MPLAVTHVILTIIVIDIYRDYILKNKSKYLSGHVILIAGIAGLLPDIDVPLHWFLSLIGISVPILQHGGITHTILFGVIFIIPGYIFLKIKNNKMATYCFVITYGILFHLLLDSVLGGGGAEGPMLLWPFTTHIYKLGILLWIPFQDTFISLDAIILLLWLWHEEMKHKIRDFI
jgi:membrane-bound metal-dependent hydrolase YbcI (DUF457 family)